MIQAIVIVLSFIPNLYLDFKIKSPFVIFTILLMILIVPPHLANLIIGEYAYETYGKAALFITLYNVLLFLFRLLFIKTLNIKFNWHLIKMDIIVTNSVFYKRMKLTYIILAVISILLSLYAATGTINLITASKASWWDFVNARSELKLPSLYLTYFLSAIPLIALVKKDKSLIFVAILNVIYFIIILRTRGAVFSYLMPLFVYFILTRVNSLSSIVRLSALGFLLIAVFFGTREVRLSGGINNLINNPPSLEDVIYKNVINGGEFELIKGFYHAIEYGSNEDSFYDGNNLIRSILLPIPSALTFGVKPTEFTYEIWNFYRGESYRGKQSFHPTVYGISYMDLYWLGLFIYPFFIALMFSFMEYLFLRTKGILRIHIYSSMVISGMLIARGSFYNGLAFSFWPIILTLLLMIIFKRNNDQKSYVDAGKSYL